MERIDQYHFRISKGVCNCKMNAPKIIILRQRKLFAKINVRDFAVMDHECDVFTINETNYQDGGTKNLMKIETSRTPIYGGSHDPLCTFCSVIFLLVVCTFSPSLTPCGMHKKWVCLVHWECSVTGLHQGHMRSYQG